MKKLLILLSVLVILSLVLTSAISCSSSPSTSKPVAPTTSTSAPSTTQTAAPAAATTFTLKVATFMPATHYVQTQQFANYFKLINDAAKGKYTIKPEYYPVGTLLNPADIHDGVAKRIADVGQMTCEYTPGVFPAITTLLIPGVFYQNNCVDSAHTAWEFQKKFQPKEFDKVKVLYCYGVGPGALHTQKPIKTVADFKGLKIRGAVRGVQAVGGEPFNVPMGEVVEDVKKGMFEACFAPAETLKGWQFNEIFHYSTFVPGFYSGVQDIIMNKDTWQSLPEDLRAIIDGVSDNAADLTGRIWEYYQQEGWDYAKAQPGGHETIELSDSELALMKSKYQPVIDKYIEELNSKGLPGQDLVKGAQEIAQKNIKLTFGTWKP